MPGRILLLDLTWAGRTWRLASRACDPVDSDGVAHHYAGGLPALDVADEIDFLEVGSPPTLDVEVVLPVEVAALVAAGHRLSGSLLSLSLWEEGEILESQLLLLSGTVASEPAYGPAGSPIRLQISTIAPVGSFPPASWSVDSETFPGPTHDPAIRGRTYPTVIGEPGTWIGYILGGFPVLHAPATPAYLVYLDASTVEANSWAPAPATAWHYLICSGAGELAARYVQLYDLTAQVSNPMPTYRARDGLGQTIWVCRLLGGAVSPTLGHEYAAAWPDPCGTASHRGGGLAGRRPPALDDHGDLDARPMIGAGEVLRWALSLTSLPVDWARLGAVQRHLDRYRVGGYWDEGCDPWAWVRDNLLPLLPISIRWGPAGLYPVVWRYWAGIEEAVLGLEDGRNCCLKGEVEWEGAEDDRLSEVAISWGRDVGGSILRQTTRSLDCLPARLGALADSRPLPREPRRLELETDLVWDTSTADLVATWLLLSRALPRRVARATSDHRLGRLCSGDVVTVTSARHSLSDQVGHVRRVVRHGPEVVEVEVLLFEALP
jgi:hypothetical protein